MDIGGWLVGRLLEKYLRSTSFYLEDLILYLFSVFTHREQTKDRLLQLVLLYPAEIRIVFDTCRSERPTLFASSAFLRMVMYRL